jgi:glycyl-tRNA synthetase
MSDKKTQLEDIVSLAKRRGFIYQGSEIYGGLSGTWDYGPHGVTLKRNIMNLWWKMFVESRDDMYGVDAAILMNQKVWQASGHTETFTDPLIEDMETKIRYRLDHLLEENGVNPEGMTLEQMKASVKEKGIKSPAGNELGNAVQFNLMFKTEVGPTWTSFEADDDKVMGVEITVTDKSGNEVAKHKLKKEARDMSGLTVYDKYSKSYLRPETAQGIFTNYKNVLDNFYPDLPFGIAQQGKAFRNEISPRDFVFRSREFEQMEVEYFVHPDKWEESFEQWRKDVWEFLKQLGLPESNVHENEIPEEDRAHYSKRTIDFDFDFPHKRDELLGLAYRTDFDLKNIQDASGRNMEYIVKGSQERFIPHVIEPSFGVERAIMAVLTAAYAEDEQNGERRVFLKLPEHLAPVKYAVFPLLKNKPELVAKAREVYEALKKKHGNVMWDDNGNIGKRYRRQDEIGTPHCITVDFQTLEDDTVTIRNRDTAEQVRKNIQELAN